jgi:hypothetical protein
LTVSHRLSVADAGHSSLIVQAEQGITIIPMAVLELRPFGPVEAGVDGRPVPLGARKQRLVLAILALEANRQVPMERQALARAALDWVRGAGYAVADATPSRRGGHRPVVRIGSGCTSATCAASTSC